MTEKNGMVNIIGSGLAGLSAASHLAEKGIPVRLISVQQSERAQSNLAEGGINAALDVMGEDDSVEEHFHDTMAGGCRLADPNMVAEMTSSAPKLVADLYRLGVPFHQEQGKMVQRNFGGQKKKRTAYAKSSTGKVLMAAMIDQVRRYEVAGLVERYCHHRFERLILGKESCLGGTNSTRDLNLPEDKVILEKRICLGVEVTDLYQNEKLFCPGMVIMACGGINGFFSGLTTGTTANTGSAAARLFIQGVRFANLEFLQYHPTTVKIAGKRLLVSEAARGEGGRLFYEKKDGSRCYFMEEKYGQRGNLMPRDVISREIAQLGYPVYLDMRGLTEQTWRDKLSDLREEIIHYLEIDPAGMPFSVSPGIHYFMGGIQVDEGHRTNIRCLYAAGECACAYHGANRLGGNSLLGAVYGGKKAAETAAAEYLGEVWKGKRDENSDQGKTQERSSAQSNTRDEYFHQIRPVTEESEAGIRTGMKERETEKRMEEALAAAMGILRQENQLGMALEQIRDLMVKGQPLSEEMEARLLFAQAMLLSAMARKESRGAHTRLDYPECREVFRKTTTAFYDGQNIRTGFETIPEIRDEPFK